MSKIRICYSQGESVRFISHLDFLRTITRTFRRAGMPIKYSEGFNPHMVMTIGLPLSVGTTSVCDCLDAELTEDVDLQKLKDTLNACAPVGIVINDIKSCDGLKPLYQIDSALYEADFVTDKEIDVQRYIDEKEIIIEKKSKRKIKEVNIKDFIRSVKIKSSDGKSHSLMLHINAGNFSNLKPELVVHSMEKYFGCTASNLRIERKEIYFDDMTRVF